MRNSIEPLNYKYLGISIVILIICYYLLQRNGNKLRAKSSMLRNIQQKTIKVHTKHGDIVMDPNMFELHLRNLKSKLSNLSGDFSYSDGSRINKYLADAKKNISSYINIQNTEEVPPVSYNICDIVDTNRLRERDILKDSIENNDDSENNHKNMIRHGILDLAIDIDIVLYLVRFSANMSGKLDLSVFDDLIMELYNSKKISSEANRLKNQITKLNNFAPEYDLVLDKVDRTNYSNKLNNTINNRLDGSQKIKDRTNTKSITAESKRDMKIDHKNRALFDNSILISHELSPDFYDKIDRRRP